MTGVPDDDNGQAGPASGPRRGTPWGLLLLWLVLACIASGMAAAVLGMPSLWGGGEAVLEYMLPLPLTWGMLHWPSLLVFGAFLTAAYRDPGRRLEAVRLACAGTLLGVAAALVLSEALRGFPLLVFVSVDAAPALLVSGLIGVPPGTVVAYRSPRIRAALVLGPAVAVAAALALGPYLQPRYKISRSDTLELGSRTDVVRFWAYARRSARDPADECPHLAKLADEYRNAYSRKGRERGRTILLFEDRSLLRRGHAGGAWVRYEWWPDGRVHCSADSDFRP